MTLLEDYIKLLEQCEDKISRLQDKYPGRYTSFPSFISLTDEKRLCEKMIKRLSK